MAKKGKERIILGKWLEKTFKKRSVCSEGLIVFRSVHLAAVA